MKKKTIVLICIAAAVVLTAVIVAVSGSRSATFKQETFEVSNFDKSREINPEQP